MYLVRDLQLDFASGFNASCAGVLVSVKADCTHSEKRQGKKKKMGTQNDQHMFLTQSRKKQRLNFKKPRSPRSMTMISTCV